MNQITPRNCNIASLTPGGMKACNLLKEGISMIRANFKLRLGDLDVGFVEKLKGLFSKNNVIEINIGDEVDETDYLLSTPANRESLFRSLEQLKSRQLISKPMNHLET